MLSDKMRIKLVQAAAKVRDRAYSPYSNYPVGSALLAESGCIYEGVNIENAAFPTSICAERVALFKAVSEGERKFKAIAVVTSNGGTPCGSCRQALSEFGLDIQVIIADIEGRVLSEMSISDLLPGAFNPDDLVSNKD